MYIYQHGAYIATCRRIEAYNEATAEQTERDREAYAEQAKYNAQFDAMMAREKICKVRLLPGDVPTHEGRRSSKRPLPHRRRRRRDSISASTTRRWQNMSFRTIIKHVEI